MGRPVLRSILPALLSAVLAACVLAPTSALAAGPTVYARAAGIAAVQLQPVYPNPSGIADAVALPVAVPANGPADGHIDIVNSAGERIRTIGLQGLAPGVTTVMWDGRNDAGR